MPQRTPGEDDPAPGQAHGTRDTSSGGFRFSLGMSRTRSMGAGGLAAASIGWVMVGCTAFGFGVGLWLDKKFGTGFWMPILTFVGIAAGFREMIVTLNQLSKRLPQDRSKVAEPSPSTSASGAPRSELAAKAKASEVPVAEAPRQRLFVVPPPPFMEQPKDFGQQELSSAEIARRLAESSRRLYGGVVEVEEGGEKSDAV